MKKCLLFIFFLFFLAKPGGQSEVQLGFLPKINTSVKLSKSIKWVNSIESRELVYDNKWNFSHSLIDVGSLFSFKTSADQSFNVGYLIRFRSAETAHRVILQYNFINVSDVYKIGHRIGFEQEFFAYKSPRYRTRYRFTFEKPLNGTKIDIKEFYLKLGSEFLYSFTTASSEVRLLPFVGYKLSSKDKIELGIDNRWSNFFTKKTITKNWFRVTLYKSF